jgi:hypothetical protein
MTGTLGNPTKIPMFIKLFTQILDSSIADNRPLRHFFTDLLLCADSRGYVIMTASAIARRIGCTVQEAEWGLEELAKPDPLSKTPDHDGARIERLDGTGYGWRILNYETYRALRDGDQMREATKERVRRYREKLKSVTDVTLVTPDVTHGSAITEGEGEAEGEEPPNPQGGLDRKSDSIPKSPQAIRIAQLYNRRPTTAWSKKEIRAFKAASPIDPEDLELVCRYTEAERAKGDHGRHRRDMATFLNNLTGELDRAREKQPKAPKQIRFIEDL